MSSEQSGESTEAISMCGCRPLPLNRGHNDVDLSLTISNELVRRLILPPREGIVEAGFSKFVYCNQPIIVKGFTTIIGKVEGEFVQEDKLYGKTEYGSERERISRTLNVSLLGFFKGEVFVRGIKEMPLIDNECFLLHAKEFSQVHNFIMPGDRPITLGRLAFERGQDIYFASLPTPP